MPRMRPPKSCTPRRSWLSPTRCAARRRSLALPVGHICARRPRLRAAEGRAARRARPDRYRQGDGVRPRQRRSCGRAGEFGGQQFVVGDRYGDCGCLLAGDEEVGVDEHGPDLVEHEGRGRRLGCCARGSDVLRRWRGSGRGCGTSSDARCRCGLASCGSWCPPHRIRSGPGRAVAIRPARRGVGSIRCCRSRPGRRLRRSRR
jgi:hypothetical protein